jgi:hypothetical protein
MGAAWLEQATSCFKNGREAALLPAVVPPQLLRGSNEAARAPQRRRTSECDLDNPGVTGWAPGRRSG